MKRRIFRDRKIRETAILLALALTVPGLVACTSDTETSGTSETAESSAGTQETASADTESDGEEKVFRLGVPGQDDDAMFYGAALAYKYGYIEEELAEAGYTLEVYVFPGAGPEINEALASGELDGAIYGDFPAFTLESNGVESTVVATVNQRTHYAILTTTGDTTGGTALEGTTIGYLFGSVIQYAWQRYVEIEGIDEDTINAVNASDATSLLTTGDADIMISEGYQIKYISSLIEGSEIIEIDPEEVYSTHVLLITDELLEEDPDVAVAFNRALIRGYETSAADPEAFYEAAAWTTIDESCFEYYYSYDESLWYLTPELTDEIREYYEELNVWLYEHEIIQKTVDVDTFIDGQYYEQAVKELAEEE